MGTNTPVLNGHGARNNLATGERSTPRRWVLGLALASTGAIIASTVGVTPAFATTVVQVGSESDLLAALQAPSTGHTFLDLTASIDTTDATTLAVPSSVSIDLAGFALTANTIDISSGATLRLLDSAGGGTLTATGDDGAAGIHVPDGAGLAVSGGTLVATGGSGGAGIGSTAVDSGVGTVSISGGSITAIGGADGAGIGGGANQGAGEIEISGGTVTATGGAQGAGIGSGATTDTADGYDAGSVLISGGTVTATGGTEAAGIGGAVDGPGGVLVITGGATVTAAATPDVDGTASAIGGGLGDSGFSSLDISGTVILAAGQDLIAPTGSPVTIHKTGVLTGAGSALTGDGTVANAGTIIVGAVDDVRNATPGALTVTGNDYAVTFDSNAATATPATSSKRIYAASLADAGLAVPAVTRPNWELTSWTDATDAPFTASSTITADETVTANWGFSHIAIAPAAGSNPTIDDTTRFIATGETAALGSLGDHTADVTFTSDGTGDTIDGALITFGSVGQRTITATSTIDGSVVGTALITVNAGSLASISVSPATLAVSSGASHVFATTGFDAHANSLGIIAATYTSSNSSDIVTSATGSIKFVKPGVRTITAHSGMLTTTSTVTVAPGTFGTPDISVSGTKSFGKTLTAHVTSPTVSGKKITYKWYRGSSTISGATKSTHKLTTKDLGRSLKVKATISATNYTTVSVTSSAQSIPKDSASLSIAVPTSLTVNTPATVTVTLGAGKSAVKPTGNVKLYVNGKSVSSLTIGASTGLRWLVPIKATKAGTITIYAQYAGSSAYASKKSATHVIKAK